MQSSFRVCLSKVKLFMSFTPSIIDIEASGFGSRSYPIEVGIVTADGSRYCRLIKPYADWDFWDGSAEIIHGISRDLLLSKGVSGQKVCHELNKLFTKQTLYCDGWSVDYPWMIRLFEHAHVTMDFRISAIELILQEEHLIQWASKKSQVQKQLQLKRHRASNDAEIIQKTYLALVQNP